MQTSHPAQERKDSSRTHRGCRRNRPSCGESAAPGLSGAGTSFSGPTRVADAEPDPLSFSGRAGSAPASVVRRPVRPGAVSRGRRDYRASLRAAPLPAACPASVPDSSRERRAPRPAPRPRAVVAPPPRTLSRFRPASHVTTRAGSRGPFLSPCPPDPPHCGARVPALARWTA